MRSVKVLLENLDGLSKNNICQLVIEEVDSIKAALSVAGAA